MLAAHLGDKFILQCKPRIRDLHTGPDTDYLKVGDLYDVLYEYTKYNGSNLLGRKCLVGKNVASGGNLLQFVSRPLQTGPFVLTSCYGGRPSRFFANFCCCFLMIKM